MIQIINLLAVHFFNHSRFHIFFWYFILYFSFLIFPSYYHHFRIYNHTRNDICLLSSEYKREKREIYRSRISVLIRNKSLSRQPCCTQRVERTVYRGGFAWSYEQYLVRPFNNVIIAPCAFFLQMQFSFYDKRELWCQR